MLASDLWSRELAHAIHQTEHTITERDHSIFSSRRLNSQAHKPSQRWPKLVICCVRCDHVASGEPPKLSTGDGANIQIDGHRSDSSTAPLTRVPWTRLSCGVGTDHSDSCMRAVLVAFLRDGLCRTRPIADLIADVTHATHSSYATTSPTRSCYLPQSAPTLSPSAGTSPHGKTPCPFPEGGDD